MGLAPVAIRRFDADRRAYYSGRVGFGPVS